MRNPGASSGRPPPVELGRALTTVDGTIETEINQASFGTAS